MGGLVLQSNVWAALPDDLFWNEILPRCDIETRVAFKARAPRIALLPIDPTLKAELERYLIWRRDGPGINGWNANHAYSYMIPYWKHGARNARIGAPCEEKSTLWPKVYLFVRNSWLGWSYGANGKTISWNQAPGTVMVHVEKEDNQDEGDPNDPDSIPETITTHVARFFIGPP